jgi:hypothetical protein
MLIILSFLTGTNGTRISEAITSPKRKPLASSPTIVSTFPANDLKNEINEEKSSDIIILSRAIDLGTRHLHVQQLLVLKLAHV